MAALTDDTPTTRREGTMFDIPVAAGGKVFLGAMVNIDANGYAKPATDTAGEKFAGISETNFDNTAGVDGADIIVGLREFVFDLAAAGMTQAAVGEKAYIVDDQTIGLGIDAQPVNVTGVTLSRIPTSRGGVRSLNYVNAATTLAWGGGAAIDVSAGGEFTLTAADGSQIVATVTAAALPGADQADNITLRHVECGVITGVISATSVWVDIAAAARK